MSASPGISTDTLFRASHLAVRIVAALSLIIFGTTLIVDRYFPAYSHVLANGWLGTILARWSASVSLLLPFYLVFQAWWMRKSTNQGKDLIIDASLAAACFVVFIGILLYTFTHASMIIWRFPLPGASRPC
jgi:hypothetical protein